jgi:hypothetical protein
VLLFFAMATKEVYVRMCFDCIVTTEGRVRRRMVQMKMNVCDVEHNVMCVYVSHFHDVLFHRWLVDAFE